MTLRVVSPGKSGASPPTKVARRSVSTTPDGLASSPRSGGGTDFGDVAHQLEELAEKLDEDDTAHVSPGSIASTSSVRGELAAEAREVVQRLRELQARLDADRAAAHEAGRVDFRDSVDCAVLPEDALLDASRFALYDDPRVWECDELKSLYSAHRNHNFTHVCEEIATLPSSATQLRDYFSSSALGSFVLHYPPSAQGGKRTNLAFALHRSGTKASGCQIFKIFSTCIHLHAERLTETMGYIFDKYGFVVVAYVDETGVGHKVRLVESASNMLKYDILERHPTMDDNKVDIEKEIRSTLGEKYLKEGDELFATFLRCRRAYVAKRVSPLGPPSTGPILVWNAGRATGDAERSGSQAALFATLENEDVGPLMGIFHPQFLAWKKNPLVRVAAYETDEEFVSFVMATGQQVAVSNSWRKFIGVEECSDEDRARMTAELGETMAALRLLAATGKGRPGTRRREIYEELLLVHSPEVSAEAARTQAMLEGQIEAGARFLEMESEDVAELDEEELQELMQAGRYAKFLQRLARAKGRSLDSVFGMSKEEVRELVRGFQADCRAGQLKQAAEFAGLSLADVEAMSEDEQSRIISDWLKPFQRAGKLKQAAEFAGLTDEDVEALDDVAKSKLIGSFIMDKKTKAALRWAGLDLEEDLLPRLSGEELRGLVRDYGFRGKVASALKWAGVDSAAAAAMSPEEEKELVNNHKYASMLSKACDAFAENFDEARDTWSPEERRTVIEQYKLLRRAETLGFSKAAVARMTPEARRQVKHVYNKRLMLQRLGITEEDEEGVDDEDLPSFAIGMDMTLDEIERLVVLREGGMTKEMSIRVTFAMSLGMTFERAQALSEAELDKVRVIRLQRGIHEKNVRLHRMFVPGMAEHAETIDHIRVLLRAYGLAILSDAFDAPGVIFTREWAFRCFPTRENHSAAQYLLYERQTWSDTTTRYWEKIQHKILYKTNKQPASLCNIVRYIFEQRARLFGALGFTVLKGLAPKPLNMQQLAERGKLQRRIETNEGGAYSRAGEEDFETVMDALSMHADAVFVRGGAWEARLRVNRVFTIRQESGKPRFVDCLYYMDDVGAWIGPNLPWGILPKERKKASDAANVEILNALHARFADADVGDVDDFDDDDDDDDDDDEQWNERIL